MPNDRREGDDTAMRLGIYVDDVYRVVARPDGAEVSVDRAFLLFACEIGRRFERLVLFGRTMRTSAPAGHLLPREVELEALHRLDAEQPGRFRLTWAGRGDLEEEVRATASELGLDERLELAGYVPFGPRLLELYRSAHVFVHVSVTEGVPQVLVEALASGTVVVATEVGGVADLLDGGRG